MCILVLTEVLEEGIQSPWNWSSWQWLDTMCVLGTLSGSIVSATDPLRHGAISPALPIPFLIWKGLLQIGLTQRLKSSHDWKPETDCILLCRRVSQTHLFLGRRPVWSLTTMFRHQASPGWISAPSSMYLWGASVPEAEPFLPREQDIYSCVGLRIDFAFHRTLPGSSPSSHCPSFPVFELTFGRSGC